METLTETTTKRVNRWNYDYICPGPVASIGDPIQDIKLYSSCPDDPIRWKYTAKQLRRMGSAVTDGSIMNPYTFGLGAPVVINDPYSNDITSFETGFAIQDVRPNDLSAAVREKPDPQLGWRTLTSQSNWAGFRGYTGPVVQSGPVSRGPEPQTTMGGPDIGLLGNSVFQSAPRQSGTTPGMPNGGLGIPTGTGGGIGPAAGGNTDGQCLRPY